LGRKRRGGAAPLGRRREEKRGLGEERRAGDWRALPYGEKKEGDRTRGHACLSRQAPRVAGPMCH
jgi:hypothetical protein